MSEVFDGIMEGLQQALAYKRGELDLKTSTRTTDGMCDQCFYVNICYDPIKTECKENKYSRFMERFK